MRKLLVVSALMLLIVFFRTVQSFSQDLLVSGGNTVSTIICANGFVYTWGANAGGLLGNGSVNNPEPIPTKVNFPAADPYFVSLGTGLTVKAVDAGSGAHFIALDCYGGAWSWGNNGGALGITGTGDVASAQVSTPARVLRGETPGGAGIHASLTNYLVDVKYISGGNDNSYAILNSGEAVGWGVNSSGQVGDGTTTNRTTPRYIRTPDGITLKNVIQIESGDITAYSLVDPDNDGIGTVYSWGSGANSRLGRNAAGTANNGSEAANDSYARPVLRLDGTPLDNIRIISAGDVMCFAMDVDGFMWGWGNGGWANLTGAGLSGVTHSDPKKVVAGEWGTTAGAGFGEPYLKVKSISGGQGYGMAVTIDGVAVAWGNDDQCGGSGGGNLGNGPGGGSGTPVIIRRSAGVYDNNVVSISDGDTWGFYTTSDNKIYTWGDNTSGQLGLGNTTCQNYATEFTLAICTFPAPKPSASIIPRDISVCQSVFAGQLLNSQFVISPTLASDYTITWFKDGSQVATGDGSATTYNATTTGTYKAVVAYVGSDAPCTPYLPAEDEIVISPYLQSYTIPTPLTFCGNLNPYVNGLGRYNWYRDPVGGLPLDTTEENNRASIPKASANAPIAGVYTVYVQETGVYVGNLGPVTPTSCASITSSDNNNYRSLIVTVTDPQIRIDTVTIWVRGETGAARSWDWRINAYPTMKNGSNKTVGNFSGAAFATGQLYSALNPSNGGAWVEVKVPVNITLPGNGATYAIAVPRGIQTAGSNNPNLADFNCSLFPKNDDIIPVGPYLKGSFGSDYYTNDKTEWGPIGNIKFTTSQKFCDRVPVTLTESCPCAPPNSVTLTPSATTTVCAGSNQTITGVADLSGLTSINGGYYYRWYKGATPITAYSTTYADLTLTAVTAADAATYTLRVEDGNTGTLSACYKEASVTINVQALPVVSYTGTTTICSGQTTNIALTSNIGGTTFSWAAPTVVGSITGSSASSGTPIAQTPTNSAAANGTVTYSVIGTVSSCPGAATDIIITVNPPLTAGTVSGDETICTSTAPTAFTETVAASGGSGSYTYQWQSSANGSSGWTNIPLATSATYAPPVLATTIYYRRVVSSGVCTSQNSNVIMITVLPGLTAGTITSAQSICYNTIPTNLAGGTLPTGGTGVYTYSWQESTNGGTTWNAAANSANSQGYTFTTALTSSIEYRRVVVSGTGTCNTAYTSSVLITVYAPLTAGSIAGVQTICSGATPTTITNSISPTGGTGLTYTWEMSTNGGVTWTTVSGATSATYSPGALITTTEYRRNVISASSCGTQTSNSIIKTVTPNTAVSVSINTPPTICNGDNITFTATPLGEGVSPNYAWTVNGSPVGTNSPNYSSTSLANGDQVRVVLTSSISCVTGSPANSNIVTASVLSNPNPSVQITPSTGTVCAGAIPTFTATPVDQGSTPTYQWYLNGAPVGTNSLTYFNNALVTGDVVHVVMTSSLTCGSGGPVTSNSVTMNIMPIPNPQIVEPSTSICSGTSATYTSIVGTGNLQWNLDGSPITGANSSSISINTTGEYTLTESNGACSTTSSAIIVTVLQTPVAYAGPDKYVRDGSLVTLNASGGVNYSWSPSTGLSDPLVANPSLTAANTTTFIVTAYDATNTCSSSDQMTLFVEKLIIIPNAITPNGDNNNDSWTIENIESYPNCDITVFNRWGTLVWKSTGYELEWAGVNFRNGETLPDGTYFYIIDLKSEVFKDPYTGYVQIVK